MNDQMPVCVTITDIVEETPLVRTIFFDVSFSRRSGQFVMVWVPGSDEIPMALSYPNAITVQRVGDATEFLFRMKKGDVIGIRGPFGNGFSVEGKVLAVAGGVGTAPLLQVAVENEDVIFLQGSKSADDLLFVETLQKSSDLRLATDDGSAGYHGFVVGLLDSVCLSDIDSICVCGPEMMMVSVLKWFDALGIAKNAQFSLQRYMKCGVGVCGSCCIDPHGLRVCRDGPVFTGDVLLNSEFGEYCRDASGRRV